MEMTHKIFNNEIFEKHKFDQFIITLSNFIDNSIDSASVNEWMKTEKAQWIRTHVKEIEYQSYKDYNTLQLYVTVTGFVAPRRWTEFVLKFT